MTFNLKTGSFALASAAFLVALTFSGAAQAKACEQLTGGACRGHWECTTDDGSSGYCNDDGAKDCYCKKGKKSRRHFGFDMGVQGHTNESGRMNGQGQTHTETPPNTPGQPH